MRAFLLFLVSLFFSFAIHAQSSEIATVQIAGQCNRYTFEITTPKAAITGIMIIKEGVDEILGSMINEFGVSAIDFRYDKKKADLKLLSVVGFLNKWYIKKTLRKDLRLSIQVLFNIPYKQDNNLEISVTADSCKIVNKKRKLTYSFNRMPLPKDDTER